MKNNTYSVCLYITVSSFQGAWNQVHSNRIRAKVPLDSDDSPALVNRVCAQGANDYTTGFYPTCQQHNSNNLPTCTVPCAGTTKSSQKAALTCPKSRSYATSAPPFRSMVSVLVLTAQLSGSSSLPASKESSSRSVLGAVSLFAIGKSSLWDLTK